MTDRSASSRRENAARWAAVFDAVVQAVITIDDKAIIGAVNPACLRMFGYDEAELVGRNVRILMPSPDAERHDSYLSNHLKTGERKIIGVGREVIAKRKDGSTFPVHLSVGRYENAGSVGFVGMIQDMSALRQTEELLAERDQILRATLDDAPLASAKLGPDGTVLSANRRFWQLLERESDAGTFRLQDCFGDHSVDDIADWTARGSIDGMLETGTGDTRHVLAHVQRLTLPSGEPLLLAQLEDQTDRVRHAAEARTHRERLERMDRISLAGEMASGIAHEVNQPLSAIANYSRALLHMVDLDRLDEDDLRGTLEKIRLQSYRAGEIVRRMRDFVSKHATDPQPTSINETISEVLSFAELSPQGRRVNVETDLPKDLPDVLFDRVQLQQVILNLVNNAVEANQFTGEDRILIRSFCENSTVNLEVEDHGMGIDEATESRLFEPFFSSKRHGTGMGLAISHSIVEGQGGTIGFRRNPDQGVTFYVQLPALRSQED